MAYEDARQLHRQVLKEASEIKSKALDVISKKNQQVQEGEKEKVVTVWNSLPWERKEVVEVDADNLGEVLTQKSWDGKALAIVELPSVGYKTVALQEVLVASAKSTESIVSVQKHGDNFVLRNQFIEATVDSYTATVNIVDVQTKRKLVQDGNRLTLYNDKPLFWDAWDIEIHHREKELKIKGYCEGSVQVDIIENGPLRCSLKVTVPISDTSSMSQIISLTCLSSRLDFNTQVEWNEYHKCLKVKFPTNIFSDFVTYDHQFGFIRRTNLQNTSWDVAKFEVSAHKYCVISEYGSGVAVMQDCKYGHSSTQDGTLNITLLRSPKAPDEHCDIGSHSFTYAVMPYNASTFQDARVIQSAYELNQPCNTLIYERAIPKTGDAQIPVESEESLLSVSVDNVLCETLKLSEDSNDHMVLRLHEFYGAHTSNFSITINTPKAPTAVTQTNILEDEDIFKYRFNHSESKLVIEMHPLKPFQLNTIKIKF